MIMKTTEDVVERPTPSAPPCVSRPMCTAITGITKPKASAFISE
jgi:hypothetical protein